MKHIRTVTSINGSNGAIKFALLPWALEFLGQKPPRDFSCSVTGCHVPGELWHEKLIQASAASPRNWAELTWLPRHLKQELGMLSFSRAVTSLCFSCVQSRTAKSSCLSLSCARCGQKRFTTSLGWRRTTAGSSRDRELPCELALLQRDQCCASTGSACLELCTSGSFGSPKFYSPLLFCASTL